MALARGFAPQDLPRLSQLRLDLPALGFAALTTALVALAAGLLPAARAAGPDLTHWLVGAGRGGGTLAARGGRARRGLIAVEAALAVVLLALAGLLSKSFWRLNRVDPGLEPGHTLVFDLSLPEARYHNPDRTLGFCQALQRRLEALPDVRRVGYIFGLPFTGFGFSSSFRVDGGPEPADGSQSGQVRLASAGYFPAQGIPLLQGRGFSPADRRGRPPVVLVSQAAARRFWPGGEVPGRRRSAPRR